MNYVFSNQEPQSVEAVGNGTWLYNWATEQIESGDWRYYSVNIGGELSSSAITLAVISAMWGDGVEAKFLNDYNAALMDLLDDSYVDAYSDFLSQRKSLKEQIEADCLVAGIN